MIKVAIAGASGYAGQETLDRVLAHPALDLYALGSDSLAGRAADALDPRLGRNGWRGIPQFITNEAALACGADVVFMCLSHEEAAGLEPPARGVVVDLSGAHRFSDGSVYESGRVFPSVTDAVGHAFLGTLRPENRFTRRYHMDGWDRTSERAVDWVSGCCMLVPREAGA